MGQGYEIEGGALAFNDELATYDGFEFVEDDELGDGEFAHRNDQTRAQDFELIVHPRRTIGNLLRTRHPISPTRCFAGKTADNGSEINSCSHGRFTHPAEFFEPAKQRFARGVSEGTFECRLTPTRSLPDDHDFAHDRATGDGRWNNSRATAASSQFPDVFAQARLLGRCAGYQRRKSEKIKLSTMLRTMQVTMGK
jgi:hypothetical protein